MDETAHFMDENVTIQSYGLKGHFMDETAKLMEKKNTSRKPLFRVSVDSHVLSTQETPRIVVVQDGIIGMYHKQVVQGSTVL